MRPTFAIVAALLFLSAELGLAQDGKDPASKGSQYPGSFFRQFHGKVYFGHVLESSRLDADAKSFKVIGEKDFDFQYLTPMGADKDAFFLANTRIPFPKANEARVLSPNNSSDCEYLIVSDGRLLRISSNKKAVEPVEGACDLPSLESVPLHNRNAAPLYFKDAHGVYFYDLYANRLWPLPKVDAISFEAHVAVYGFNLYWGMDKAHVYAGKNLVNGIHRTSFEYVGWVYAKDKYHVYVMSNTNCSVVPGADPKSFYVVKGRGVDACDKKHCYSRGKSVD